MSMVCPQCSRSFDQHLLCPTCGVRLQYQGSAASSDETGQWVQTPWGRLFVGLLLAQGLAHGLQMFATAGLLAASDEAETVWRTLVGLVVLHSMQGFSLLIGGGIAGAGQRRGVLYGAFIGLINGVIFVILQRDPNQQLPAPVVYGQPLFHLAFGALGGLLGQLIWRPMPEVRIAVIKEGQPKIQVRSASRPEHWLAGEVAWIRVMAGCAIVIAGVVWSQSILNFMVEASQKRLTIRSHLQAQLVSWEITALAAMIGAGLAGATTSNGLKQGLFVGLCSSIVLVGMHLGSNEQAVLESTLLLVFSVAGLGLAGGWFGGQLFPPVYSGRRRHIAPE